MQTEVRQEREALVSKIFPRGIPRLWCPPVTHYRFDGSLDADRIQAHITALAPHVGGLLVPGSTGDGWELSRGQKLELLDIVLPLAGRLGLSVLVGALEPTGDGMVGFIDIAGSRLRAGPVAGIVVCAPTGAEKTAEEIEATLGRVLGLGLPTALYQLPQITGNEIAPATAARLAATYPNFYMLKDSSGVDHIARSSQNLDGVFLVRGAESGYSGWYKPRGPYDGFLLSTANWLAPQLAEVVAGTSSSELDTRIDDAVAGAFSIVPGYPTGNAFGNSAKLMDHIVAWGSRAAEVSGPYSRDGRPFPPQLVLRAQELCRDHGLLPPKGYMQQ